jgi:hypothetical protein
LVFGSDVEASSLSHGSGIGTWHGIGGGYSGIDTLVIEHAMVNASSLSYGSGVGTGSGENGGMSRIGNLTIVASTMVAHRCRKALGLVQVLELRLVIR